VEKGMHPKREKLDNASECRAKQAHGGKNSKSLVRMLESLQAETDRERCGMERQLLHTDGVYGIGEHSAKYFESLDNEKIQIMAFGGNLDWAP
jgi:hypothetical protein